MDLTHSPLAHPSSLKCDPSF